MVDGHVADLMSLNAHPRKSRGHIVVMPKGFLQKSLKEFHAGDGAELQVVDDLLAGDFFSELVLEVGIQWQIVEAHGHEMRGGICSCDEEDHEFFDELIDVIAIFRVQKSLLLDGVKHSAFFLVLLS